MNNFVDYNPTEEEIVKIFGTEDDYKIWLGHLTQYPDSDTEKHQISHLLFLRGEREESRKVIESIEDEEYRRTCRHAYVGWVGWEEDVHVF